MLRSTLDNHRDSRLYLLITLSRKRRIQLSATLGDELFCLFWTFATMEDEQFATLGDVDELFATLGWDKSESGQNKAPD